MENKLKRYCMTEYYDIYYHGGDIEKAIDRCYGAIMFCINNCFDDYNENLGKWWNNVMLPKFEKLERK